MSFCWDVYVWLPQHTPEIWQRFIDHYVDTEAPGDDRLAAFRRTYVTGDPTAADTEALAELLPSDGGQAFTLYLHGREHPWAMLTVAEGEAAVLGVSIDDPEESPAVREQAERMIDQLRREFDAPAGVAGVELPPPGSAQQWRDDQVQLRVGTIDQGLRAAADRPHPLQGNKNP